MPAAGSSTPGGSTTAADQAPVTTLDSTQVPDTAPEPMARPRTRLHSDIVRKKVYTDGTIRYGMYTCTGELSDLDEALGDPKWRAAIEEEYKALLRNKTWHLVPARKGMNIIDCRWAFKIKRKANSTIDMYKGRLVAKGYK